MKARITFSALSMLPVVCYGLILLYACYAATVVGHWPYYSHPDPKELPARGLLSVVAVVFLTGIFSVATLPFGYGFYRAIAKWRRMHVPPHGIAVGIYCVGAVFWIADVAAEFSDLPWRSLVGWVLD